MPQTLVEKVTGRSGFEKAVEDIGLFGPDTVARDQYFDIHKTNQNLEPEKKLMMAVLEDAVACFQDNIAATDPEKKVLYDDALVWFVNTNNDWLFSFDNVCDALGLTPSYVRRGLLAWKDEYLVSIKVNTEKPKLHYKNGVRTG